MFDVNMVNLHYGSRHILRDATFKVEDGERAAIIGPNGAGKSTLLKVIAGILSPESGKVSYPNNTEIGYLPQDVILETNRTVEEECRTVFQEVLDHEQEMRDIEQKMADDADMESDAYHQMCERYDYLMHETMRRDIYSMDSNIGRVMNGLGFSAADLQKPCSTFSGGWQMRIALGKILLSNPDILLLDEPTNHLDIETIEWLGQWLANHDGSILMVSHERAFMDKLVNKVVEVDPGGVVVYRGNYSESLVKRDERRDQQRRAYENQQIEIAQIQKFIDRFRYQASKAALVQSRIKQLEKIKICEPPSEELSTINFRFPPAPRSGKEVIVTKGISKSFGNNHVLKDIDFELYRGEKVALVGVNGAGKSTFMKILAGHMQPDEGKVNLGSAVDQQYFAQYDYEDLHDDNTVLGEFLSKAPLKISNNARGILGAFLFQNDDVEKKIEVLSGGEKTRLRLARMLCGSANLLMLDEPTNHLDIGSRLTLESALKQYEGAVVLVSHDKYFLNNVVTRVVEIRDQIAYSYPGNYEDYLRLKERQEEASKNSNGAAPKSTPSPKVEATPPPPAPAETVELSKDEKRDLNNRRNDLQKQIKKLQKEFEESEDAVMEKDTAVRELENAMADPDNATNPEKLQELTSALSTARKDLEKAEEHWTSLQLEVEEMESELEQVQATMNAAV